MMNRLFFVILLVVLSVFSRLIPHPWNLTAVGSVAMFAGAYIRPKSLAISLPVLAFFVSDLIIGFHETMLFTYGAVLISSILGLEFLKDVKVVKVLGLSVLSSLIFFVVSNLGVWLATDLYPQTLAGLTNCFVMAIPFFQGQIAGDLLYSAVLFGSYALVSQRAQWQPVSR